MPLNQRIGSAAIEGLLIFAAIAVPFAVIAVSRHTSMVDFLWGLSPAIVIGACFFLYRLWRPSRHGRSNVDGVHSGSNGGDNGSFDGGGD